mmetsp:Transcript_24258/g.41089  ORF Transcript_24258/g.41089 Transcript_24258/m.41089 type:complete len:209 (+) Transcript_24258:427-1053(+)
MMPPATRRSAPPSSSTVYVTSWGAAESLRTLERVRSPATVCTQSPALSESAGTIAWFLFLLCLPHAGKVWCSVATTTPLLAPPPSCPSGFRDSSTNDSLLLLWGRPVTLLHVLRCCASAVSTKSPSFTSVKGVATAARKEEPAFCTLRVVSPRRHEPLLHTLLPSLQHVEAKSSISLSSDSLRSAHLSSISDWVEYCHSDAESAHVVE